MAVDLKMLPMKAHYLLRFLGTGPLTAFLPVIARQRGLSARVVGVVWTVLPFVSLVSKTLAGALADVKRCHRAVFLGGLLLMLTCLTALYWVPGVQPLALDLNNSTLTPSSPLASVTSAPAIPGDGERRGSVQISNASSDSAPASPCSRRATDGRGVSFEGLWGRYEFWLLFLCLLGQYCGHITVITMQETVCFLLLGEERHKYGQQRVWGTIGMGLSAVVSGALVDWYSKGLGRQDYLPAHLLTAVFLAADVCLVAKIKFPRPKKKMNSAALQGALWRPQVILVLVTTGVVGAVSGLLWAFQFLLVEDVACEWQPQFPHLKLLLGLVMGVQSFLAEAPFFILAGRIILRLGQVNTLFVSLLGFALRLVLYAAITNPWWFLPIDLLHGISFGVAYPCFTSYASIVAPKGAAATTQAIFGATFFGSTGFGSLLGGWLFQAVGGRKTFLIMGVATGIYAVLFLATHALITRLAPRAEAENSPENAERGREEADTKAKIDNNVKEEEEVKDNLLRKKGRREEREMVRGVSYRKSEMLS